MLNKSKIAEFAKECLQLKKVKIESMDDECFVRKLVVGDSVELADKVGQDVAFTLVKLAVVDEKGHQLFDSVDEVKTLPSEVISEMAKHVSEHNAQTDMESAAKK